MMCKGFAICLGQESLRAVHSVGGKLSSLAARTQAVLVKQSQTLRQGLVIVRDQHAN